MKSAYGQLIQSKYFTPAFNSAIFDGPIRIYFAQFHESLALKIYFYLQQKMNPSLTQIKDGLRSRNRNIFLMIYPSDQTFIQSFDEIPCDSSYMKEPWEDHLVIGLRHTIEDSQLNPLVDFVFEEMKKKFLIECAPALNESVI
ncbi:MAG: hypothetical protein V4736_03365 [Bdellovibrionota bacterium]